MKFWRNGEAQDDPTGGEGNLDWVQQGPPVQVPLVAGNAYAQGLMMAMDPWAGTACVPYMHGDEQRVLAASIKHPHPTEKRWMCSDDVLLLDGHECGEISEMLVLRACVGAYQLVARIEGESQS
jgi:hypothetical protein